MLLNRFHAAVLVSWTLLSFTSLLTPTDAADRIRFNEQIRPLLSDRCFACHGPDGKRREADLRLDLRPNAIGEADGPAAIVPGKPDESHLWKRIISTDPDLQMPPPSAKKPRFTAEELSLLRRWIEEGAVLPDAASGDAPARHVRGDPRARQDRGRRAGDRRALRAAFPGSPS